MMNRFPKRGNANWRTEAKRRTEAHQYSLDHRRRLISARKVEKPRALRQKTDSKSEGQLVRPDRMMFLRKARSRSKWKKKRKAWKVSITQLAISVVCTCWESRARSLKMEIAQVARKEKVLAISFAKNSVKCDKEKCFRRNAIGRRNQRWQSQTRTCRVDSRLRQSLRPVPPSSFNAIIIHGRPKCFQSGSWSNTRVNWHFMRFNVGNRLSLIGVVLTRLDPELNINQTKTKTNYL